MSSNSYDENDNMMQNHLVLIACFIFYKILCRARNNPQVDFGHSRSRS
jgi:hypothetical protein